jgi:hypothetical protein
MAAEQIHRASTFAPVNIAVIKYVDTIKDYLFQRTQQYRVHMRIH